MAHQLNLANFPIPECIGFNPNPNIVIPTYVITEARPGVDQNGVPVVVRRPRPLSLMIGAWVVLQSDQELLRQ
jgi:hypothetical protein